MTALALAVAFHAEDAADARQQARAWAAAEPNVESCRVLGATNPDGRLRWTVRVRLVLRGGEQLDFGSGWAA